jgi:hypothetical protein
MKRKVKVDMMELDAALQSSSYEMRYYLDLETGRIVLITGEMSRKLDRIYEEIYDEEKRELTVTLEEYLEKQDDPDWQKQMLLDADRIEREYGSTELNRTRYIRVEQDDPHADYNDMERFIRTVEDPELRDRLWRAIRGRGAFRYFKDVLYDHPEVREQWFEFKDAQQQRRLERWLENHDIEPIS